MARPPRLCLAALGSLLAVAAFAPVSGALQLETAPGRVLVDLAGGRVRLRAAAALPDGGALLAGQAPGSGRVFLVEVDPDGLPVTSFGSQGLAEAQTALLLEQAIVTPSGEILLVGLRSGDGRPPELGGREPHPPLIVVRLLPDGAVDPSFGAGGTVQTPVEAGCLCGPRVAVLEGDGSLVLTGQRAGKVRHSWGSEPTTSWVLERLTATGSPDPSFGTGGVAAIAGGEGIGLTLEAGPAGSLSAQGQVHFEERNPEGGVVTGAATAMTRITSDGTIDPAYAGGRAFRLPFTEIGDSGTGEPSAFETLSEPSGETVVETFLLPANPGRPRRNGGIGLIGYDNAGAFDRTFGFGGALALEEGPEAEGSQLLAEPDGSMLAVHRRGSTRPGDNRRAVPGIVEFERITPVGRFDPSFLPPGKAVPIPFGGGYGEPLPSSRYSYPEVDFTLSQNGFLGPDTSPLAVPLADGRVLLAGDVTLTAAQASRRPDPTTNRIGIALLTPQLDLDTAAGGPAVAPAVALVTSPQSRSRDLARRALTVTLATSRPGLTEIDVRAGGRLLARRLVARLAAGRSEVPISLSRRARRRLSARRHLTLRVTAVLHDLLAGSATASSSLVLH